MADSGARLDLAENIFKDASSKANKKLSVERIYQKKTQLEHILLRPDTYIGSVESVTQGMWVYDEEAGMVHREITFVPGLYKIFDEILVNAADNKQRDKNMDCIKIDIDPEKNKISIWNNGRGVPVVEHKDEKMFVPSLIFGHLLTSSNYNDEEKKVTGGRNGYGAKLCNIFSNKFLVETSCKQYNKCFKQTWSDNMLKASEPKIVPSKGEDFTCVTFYPDLKKFNMDILDKDIVSLMSRRAFDVAGCARGVKVFLNGKRLPVKGFKEYVELYCKNKEDENGDSLTVVHEIVNERWEVALTISDHGLQQVSFVNSIATTKGGRHVDHVVDMLVSKIADAVKKKNKTGKDVRPLHIKNHLWVFVNCLIENPTFDSQTKENMTLQVKSFGSRCALTDKFLNQTLKCGIVEAVMTWVQYKAQTDLNKKCSAKKHSKLKGIPKLEDANDAGTRGSIDCTLILTEGDSAKSFAVSGLGVVGRDKYGVFPLKGKLLNVREATHKQILENAEINNVIKIMGLQYKKKYDTVDDLKTLRYGRLMIMTDQDQDGSHIKGLLINFIHHNWPSLLRLPFLEEFITPIVKATKGKDEKSFYSLPEFEEWKKETSTWPSWKIKYYKGLGTSTSKEAKEYFSDMLRHRIKFQYTGNDDDKAIQLAFSRKMVDFRKEWLTNGMEERKRRRELGLPEIYMYNKDTTRITYNDFINKEFILYSNLDNERSIPSLIDGLKPGQRKVLFTCLKLNDKKEYKVAQLGGSVAQMSAYHHGENSLVSTIVGLAQNFVGSNNINILLPIGQFGTRLQGGKDSASPRYIFTQLNSVTRHLFCNLDEPLLNNLYDDNLKIEPEYYVPIIPMVLVNGAEGIGTGWSTKVPNYNPRELVENVRLMLDGKEPKEMMPWFKNYRGSIQSISPSHYATGGEIALLDNNKIEISELPIRVWTQSYKESVLETMLHGSEKVPSFIADYKEYNTDTTVRFVVSMTPEKLALAERQGLHKVFKLQTTFTTTSMVLFDQNGVLKKYENAIEIFKEFYEVRYVLYEKRKDYLIGLLGAESSRLSNQARFILEKIENKIVIENRKKAEMIATLKNSGYDVDPVKAWKQSQKNRDDVEENSDSDDEKEAPTSGPDYDYLLGMSLWSLTREKKDELLKKRDEKQKEFDDLKMKSPADLWRDDLKAFLVELDKVQKKEIEDEASVIVGKGKSAPKKKKTGTDETKPSVFGERIDYTVDEELKNKHQKKPAGDVKRARKKKDDIKLDDEEDSNLVPLGDRVTNSGSKVKGPKSKEAKPKKTMKQGKLSFPPASKTSPNKNAKKNKKNPWSDTESEGSISEVSDIDPENYIPPEKREISRRKAAEKAKYIFDSEEEKSGGSGVEMYDHDPEGLARSKEAVSSLDDGSDSEPIAKAAGKKAPAPKQINGANEKASRQVSSDSDNSDDMFRNNAAEKEKPSENLFDSLLDGNAKTSEENLQTAPAVPQRYDSDSDSSISLTVEKEMPPAKKRDPPAKKRARKEQSSDDDFEAEAKKPPAKKPAPARKKKASENGSDGKKGKAKKPSTSRPPAAKKTKKSVSDDDEISDVELEDDEDSFVVTKPRGAGRARAPVKYSFGDDSSD